MIFYYCSIIVAVLDHYTISFIFRCNETRYFIALKLVTTNQSFCFQNEKTDNLELNLFITIPKNVPFIYSTLFTFAATKFHRL